MGLYLYGIMGLWDFVMKLIVNKIQGWIIISRYNLFDLKSTNTWCKALTFYMKLYYLWLLHACKIYTECKSRSKRSGGNHLSNV